MTIDLTEIIITLITLVLVPLVSIICKEVIKYFKAKTDSIAIKNVLDDVGSAVKTQVNSLMQTVVLDAKNKAEDGKLTKEEADEILHTAIERASNNLTKSTKDYLDRHGVELGEYLEDKIEAYIADTKIY